MHAEKSTEILIRFVFYQLNLMSWVNSKKVKADWYWFSSEAYLCSSAGSLVPQANQAW